MKSIATTERLTQEEMVERIRNELLAGEHIDPAVLESIICYRVGEWVQKGWHPPLITLLRLMQDHGLAL